MPDTALPASGAPERQSPLWQESPAAPEFPAEPARQPAAVAHEASASQTPPGAAAAQSQPTPRFADASRLALVAQVLLGLAAVVALATAFEQILGVDLQGRINSGRALQADAAAFNSTIGTLSLLSAGLEVVTGVIFMRWQWQSMVNARYVGAGTSGYGSTRFAMVSWIVPILNFVRPYQFIAELHARLLAPLQSSPGRWLLRAWWTLWLAGGAVGLFVLMLSSAIRAGSADNRLPVIAGQAIVQSLILADAILAIGVVRRIQRLGDARIAAQQGESVAAADLLATTQRRRAAGLPLALAGIGILAVIAPLSVTYAGSNVTPQWAQFTPADSSFTVSMPGSPQETTIPAGSPGSGTLTDDTFRSGENGNLVFIITYYDYPAGELEAMTPASIYSNMDRAIAAGYSIASKSDTTISGLPAHEIHATGSDVAVVARYVVVQNRVYVVEVDAQPAAADSPDVARFLNSFTVR
jgi:hypothetical protein